MKMSSFIIVQTLFALTFGNQQQFLTDLDLFVGQVDGHFCYRLPNLIQLKEPGKMMAIAEGHKVNCDDGGHVDLVMRKTLDDGKTWSDMVVIYSDSHDDGGDGRIGNPAAIFDADTDTIHLFAIRNTKQVLLFTSEDEGEHWSAPRDLTSSLVPSNWNGVFTGVPQGLQLENKRLIVCANHITDQGGHSHTIYSDDHGETWHNGDSVQPSHMGECSLTQTQAGVFMYARVWWDDNSNRSTRALAFSSDNGKSFTQGNTSAFPNNPGRDSQGALISTTIANNATTNVDDRAVFLVGSPWGYSHFPRVNYTILVSTAATSTGMPTNWTPLPGADPLWSGPAAYSTLSVRKGSNTFFTIYERGVNNSNEVLRFTQLNLPSLSDV